MWRCKTFDHEELLHDKIDRTAVKLHALHPLFIYPVTVKHHQMPWCKQAVEKRRLKI